jgi:hypothetical protein
MQILRLLLPGNVTRQCARWKLTGVGNFGVVAARTMQVRTGCTRPNYQSAKVP